MPACAQAIVARRARETGIVLLAREALLLRRRDDLAVLDQRGRAVVVERRDPENAHAVGPLQNSV